MNAAQDFGRVAVLMGGWSAEREVSLRSGNEVLSALQTGGVDAHKVDVNRDIAARLLSDNFDRAFNVLHGPGGEDGVIQGLLDIIGLPYTGSGVKASAITMDKIVSKRIWRSAGLPTPAFQRLTENSDWSAVVTDLGLPLIVKPVSEGSSIGMSVVESEAQLPVAWKLAAEHANDVFAEQWVDGEEYTVAILADEALPAIKLITPHRFYDYSAKYEVEDTQYICPCGLSYADEAAIADLSLSAFQILDASGWGRVDLMRDTKGEFLLIEVNTVPGMTSHSLVPKAAKQAGMDFPELVKRILATTLEDQANG